MGVAEASLVLLTLYSQTLAEPVPESVEEALTANSNQVTGLVGASIILLLVATAVALITRRFRIPYVVGLVLGGLLITPQALPAEIGLNPDVILNLFLPILIFEAAINTDISRLRSTIKPILLLATRGCSGSRHYHNLFTFWARGGLDYRLGDRGDFNDYRYRLSDWGI